MFLQLRSEYGTDPFLICSSSFSGIAPFISNVVRVRRHVAALPLLLHQVLLSFYITMASLDSCWLCTEHGSTEKLRSSDQ